MLGTREGLEVRKIMRSSSPFAFYHAALMIVLLSACPSFGKRKDDIVIMNNGDKFTGEIKALQYGELIFKSSYMKDDVHLDWKEVKTLQSHDAFIVGLSDGKRVTGFISRETSDAADPIKDDEYKIIAEGAAVNVAASDVIAIGQREVSFWDQLTGSINYGFDFSSGNTATTSSLGADVAYRTAKNSVQLATSSQFGSQKNTKDTNRFTFDSQYARLITNHWLVAGLFSVLKSNQQDLNLRSTYGAAMGRRLIQTDKTALTVLAGGAYNHESYVPQSGTEPVRSNAESLFGVTFSTFRFKTLNLNSQTLLFPSLSDPGRLRITSQSYLRIELVRNFYWNFQVYENYDTRPPINAPKNDLGLTTSLGWTF
jgi:putative salt-induced outer membrane protein YdiY